MDQENHRRKKGRGRANHAKRRGTTKVLGNCRGGTAEQDSMEKLRQLLSCSLKCRARGSCLTAIHHRGAAQEARPSDDLVQSCPTQCGSIETTLRTRRILWAGTLIRMSGGRLPKRIMFGNLEGAERRERGGKDQEWTDCVQSDIRAFGITGDWKATAVKAEVWVDTVTEGGRGLRPRGGNKR